MIELEDTVELMLSDDWKKRLVAEYAQAKIRFTHAALEKCTRDVIEPGWNTMMYINEKHMKACLDRMCQVFSLEDAKAIWRWVTFGDPLTIFNEPQEKLIKIKQFPGEPRIVYEEEWNHYYVEQVDGEVSYWYIPTYEKKEDAVYYWNLKATSLNHSLDKYLNGDK